MARTKPVKPASTRPSGARTTAPRSQSTKSWVRRWPQLALGIDEPETIGQVGYEIPYWKGKQALASRPLTIAEFEALRWKGVRLRRAFWVLVMALGLGSIEAWLAVGSRNPLNVLVVAGLVLCLMIAFLLLPAVRCALVPRDAEVMTFKASETVEVVVPGGVGVSVDGRRSRLPMARRLRYVAPPPAKAIKKVGNLRDLTPSEIVEVKRRYTMEHAAWPLSTLLIFGLNFIKHLAQLDFLFVALDILFVVLVWLWFRRHWSGEPPTRVRLEVVDDEDGKLGEYLEGAEKPWTIDGAPAKWRIY